MTTEYYIALNGQSIGPMTLEQFLNQPLHPDSLVWKTGLPEWVKAMELPELAHLFYSSQQPAEEKIWYAMIDGTRQIGPMSISELIFEGINLNTPVWKAGMADWQPAFTQEDLRQRLENRQEPPFANQRHDNSPNNQFANNPQYNPNYYYNSQRQNQNNYYNRQQNYHQQNGNQYPNSFRTNWLPWAIGATVVGLLCSCIGAIFGIIGIVQANKANTLFSRGYDEAGERANSNAKTMTIIGYVFAGIGIIFSLCFRNFYSSLLNVY